jgi:hypothetical protein
MKKEMFMSSFVSTTVVLMFLRGALDFIFGYTPLEVINIGNWGFIASDEYSLYTFNPFLDYLLFGSVFSLLITYVFSQIEDSALYLFFYLPFAFTLSGYIHMKNLMVHFAFIFMFVIFIALVRIFNKEGLRNISIEFLPVVGVSVVIGIYSNTASSFMLMSIFAVIIISAHILTRILTKGISIIYKK